MRTRYAALAATFVLAAALTATLLLTSNAAPQPTSVAQQHRRTRPATRPPLRSRRSRRTAARHRSTPLASSPSTKARRTTTPRSRTSPTRCSLQPDDDGRYQVERGQQITVVTAAPLPTGYTRFYLQRQPLQVSVSPTSFEQLIQPVGTTYTFTVTTDDAGANLISFVAT